jgi:hypothetical protein
VLKNPAFAKQQNVRYNPIRQHDNRKLIVKQQTKCQPFAKLNELKTNAQAVPNCSAFYFAQPHPPPDFGTTNSLKEVFVRSRH